MKWLWVYKTNQIVLFDNYTKIKFKNNILRNWRSVDYYYIVSMFNGRWDCIMTLVDELGKQFVQLRIELKYPPLKILENA